MLLIALACVVFATPAEASERSEARAYLAALEAESVPSTAALVADYEFRAAYAEATCLNVVEQGVRDHGRELGILLLYAFYAVQGAYAAEAERSQRLDDRLAAIPTESLALRQGRADRRRSTRLLRNVADAASEDFCVEAAAWQAKGWKGASPSTRRVRAVIRRADEVPDRRLRPPLRVLARHGATPAQRRAFAGREPDALDAVDLEHDAVVRAIIETPRRPPDGPSVRRP